MTTPLTDARIDEIRKRCEAATALSEHGEPDMGDWYAMDVSALLAEVARLRAIIAMTRDQLVQASQGKVFDTPWWAAACLSSMDEAMG